MSKVKIEGNASGTGTLTISAPNTNTDRNLTLPDGAGEILLSDGDGSNLTGISVGISEADVWTKDTDDSTSGNAEQTETYWVNLTTFSRTKVGTGMTHSSGVFTFPSTGKWLVRYNLSARASSSGESWIAPKIQVTTDNGSNWDLLSFAYTSGSAYLYCSAMTEEIIDVTDVSNVKVRFRIQSADSVYLLGETTNARTTTATFIKLGET